MLTGRFYLGIFWSVIYSYLFVQCWCRFVAS